MSKSWVQRVVLLFGAIGMLIGAGSLIGADAAGTPADKTAASGSGVDEVNSAAPILQDTIKVDSAADLVLSATVECSIINRLVTNTDNPSAQSVGRVKLWVTVDGIVVPVADDDPANDKGKVVFCDRTYGRTMTDQDGNGLDQEDDFIATRTANAFNWLAIDAGTAYDDEALNGNNTVEVKLWAEFQRTNAGDVANACPSGTTTCAQAWVGKRTLLMDATHVAVNERVARTDEGA